MAGCARGRGAAELDALHSRWGRALLSSLSTFPGLKGGALDSLLLLLSDEPGHAIDSDRAGLLLKRGGRRAAS